VFSFAGVINGSVLLGILHVISVAAAFGAVGVALTVHGGLLALNIGRLRDRGLTMFDLERRVWHTCLRRLPPGCGLRRADDWLEERVSIPSRQRPLRILSSLLTVLIGLFFFAISIAATTSS